VKEQARQAEFARVQRNTETWMAGGGKACLWHLKQGSANATYLFLRLTRDHKVILER
jgi:hypothetical protein